MVKPGDLVEFTANDYFLLVDRSTGLPLLTRTYNVPFAVITGFGPFNGIVISCSRGSTTFYTTRGCLRTIHHGRGMMIRVVYSLKKKDQSTTKV